MDIYSKWWMEVSGRFRTVAMFFSHDCEFNCELRKEFLANLLLRALELLVEKFSPAGWPWCLKNVKGIHIWKHCKKCENALSPGSLSRSVLVRHVKVWSKFWRLHVDKVTDQTMELWKQAKINDFGVRGLIAQNCFVLELQ